MTQRRPDTTDEAGRVLVDDVEHVAGQIGFHLDAEQFDQTRLLRSEQRAGDGALAGRRLHRDAHQRLICAFAIVAHFAHVEAAFLGEIRRIDHVHRVGIGAHQARQHRCRDRLLVQFRGMAFDFDRNALHLVAFKLPQQAAHLFGERHVGLELGRFLCRQAGHVERVGDAAVQQIVGQLLGHLQRDVDLRFVRGRAQMRGRDEVGGAEQRAFLGRFGHEHVECCAADMAAVQTCLQRRFVDQAAARAVDDAHTLFGLGQRFGGQDVAGLVGQRRVQGDEVGAGEQLVQRDLFHAHIHGAFGRQERIERNHLHLEAQSTVGDDRADVTRTDQAQHLAGDFDAHEAVLLPLAGLRGRIGFGQLAREGEDKGNGMFGGGDRVAERGVHDHDALGGCGGDVDIVDADPCATDDLQVGGRVEDRFRHFGRGTDGEAVILADDRDQLFGRLAGDFVDFDAPVAEDLSGAGVHFIGNENFGHDIFLLFIVTPGLTRGPAIARAAWRKSGTPDQVRGDARGRVRQPSSGHKPSRAKGRALRYRRCRQSRRTRCAGRRGHRDNLRCRMPRLPSPAGRRSS